MADPLATPAIVGAVVSMLLKQVLDSCKESVRLKESCKTLKSKVDDILPLLEAASTQSGKWDKAVLDWLHNFKVILQEAEIAAKRCIEETKCETVVRMIKAWKWRKLSKRIKGISARIDEARSNANLAVLGVIQTSASKATSRGVEFVTQPTPPLIVGSEETFNKLKSCVLASFGRDKASYLALRGRGGAGKTLLAKQLHNDEDIQAKYGRKSILWITVGSDARIHDIYKTMGKFLEDEEFQAFHATKNLEDQRSYLLSAFAKRKIFMILDDVWSKSYEYHAMIYWLALATTCGSTTLVTSRIANILSNIEMESSSTQGKDVEEEVVFMLPQEDSWKLFCFYAFQASTPRIEEGLARKVCQECKGLPLALKVIGSAMKEKQDVKEWQRALCDLQRSKPILDSNVDEELYDRLRLSYNELKSDELRRCFLYCAAFPEDYNISVSQLIQIWTIEGLVDGKDEAMSYLETLVRRSLVDWNDKLKDYIVVHDILRDLAMYIINTARFGECAKDYIFESGKEVTSFSKFKSLQEVKAMSLGGSRVSQWPRTFATPHLRVLIISGLLGPLQMPPQIFSRLQALQYLDLSLNPFDDHDKLPSFEGLVGLSVLTLSECRNFCELSKGIGELESLLELDLSWCFKMENIPKSIGNMKCLTSLKLRGCASLKELPESIGELTSLFELDLDGCKNLKEVPESIGELESLLKLHISGCLKLEEIPKSIGNLKSLTSLKFGYCKSLIELPKSIGELTSLFELELYECENLKEVPKSIGALESLLKLNLRGCLKLEEIPKSIGNLKCLTSLKFGGCESLKELPQSIGELTSLLELDLVGCKNLKEVPMSVGALESLLKLNLNYCLKLEEIPKSIGNLECLTSLDFWGCESLKELPRSIGELTSLLELDLCGCNNLKEVPESIGELELLLKLNLSRCFRLEEIPKSIGNLKCLTSLKFGNCVSLKELPQSIGELTSLLELDLVGCKNLNEVPKSIGALESLLKLNLS